MDEAEAEVVDLINLDECADMRTMSSSMLSCNASIPMTALELRHPSWPESV